MLNLHEPNNTLKINKAKINKTTRRNGQVHSHNKSF